MDQVRSSCFHFAFIVLCTGLYVLTVAEAKNEANLKGHLQPFGESGTRREIEVRNEFPDPRDFLVEYVQNLKPLKLSGVAKNSRAVREWTDSYLLALDVPSHSVVGLETRKKESREQETTEMHFHDFLRIYNQTEHYMVDDVPDYLSPDVNVPCSLQCPEMLEKGLAFAMMWFSSGGTKSVVHTDSFDNINCVIRGEKTFVMVDPARDREKVQLRFEGAYSDIDVDSVDLKKYPQLADAEFYHVHVKAGDCLYIPYHWIHQVRSFHSNVAINFWWSHYATMAMLEEKGESACQGHCDPDLTLDKVKIYRQDPTFENYNSVRDWLRDYVLERPMTLPTAVTVVKTELGADELPLEAEKLVLEMFIKMDVNGDGQFTKEDHDKIPEEMWKETQRKMVIVSQMLKEEEVADRREYAEYVEADRRDEL
ncbi:bifunctional peptidase and (3S)-lysyl hydroxylase JMJD7-like [Babylonia areolata]|uniref:bifunctional peptidase and (3S)-lysyl hydroxylase JMJD7-like n=1 Tax=Babylonia areolata TaxID=304850 RepID=UPI003FD59BDB